jgi:aryl-alcohol dehydrogenase-like predicted oxidoreductase
VAQDQWSILHHPPETEAVRRWCATAGVAFLAWSPLASGYLVDGFDPEATAPGDLRRRLRWATGNGARALEAVRAEAEAEAAGRPLREHALAGAAATARPIVGARSPAEAQEVSTLSKALAARQQSS